tara:strand:- start:507 stop:821 length:315 start_codon:yes stop_codon:yes gene_type:complete
MIYFYIFGFQTKSFLFIKIKTTRINLISIFLLLLFSVKGFYDNHDGSPNLTDTSIGVAAGAIVGTKWVNKKKASFEIHAGVGRFLNFDKGRAYPRINFAIGKRF